jgi:PIN domain nuclease of toxin-antitoxin system
MKKAKYLLDTHCLLWFQDEYYKISDKVLDEIKNIDNDIYFSQVSLFEIAIKQKIGKLPNLKTSTEEIYNTAINDGFSFLSIENKAIASYQNIPLLDFHRDPFDRLLLATAFEHKLSIITADQNFIHYKKIVNTFW